jgi:peptide/nickel transport system substrate-binding protein
VRILAVAAFLLLCAVAGCGSPPTIGVRSEDAPQVVPAAAAASCRPAYGDRVIMGDIAEPSVLLPVLAVDTACSRVASLIFNGLLDYDRDLNVVGDLAESFEITETPPTVRFRLRKGVRWHDGRPFTSKDVAFTVKLYVDPTTPTPYASAFMRIKRLRTPDDYTVEAEYECPYGPALDSWVYNKILPAHLFEGTDVTTNPLKRAPIGTGPFRFREWNPGERITLEANDDYFRGRPFIDQVIFRIIPDQAAMFLELQGGRLDHIRLTPMQFSRQTTAPWFEENFARYRHSELGYVYLGYNLRDPRFSDKRVRQALTSAIDREAVVKCVHLGLARVAYTPYGPDTFWHNRDVKKWDHCPERAARLLNEAGWKDLDGDGVLEKDGKPFEFTILTNQGNVDRRNACALIQHYLKKVGVRAHVRVLEWAALLKNFLGKGNFDAYVCGWVSHPDPDATDQWNSTKTGPNQFNYIGFQNEEADRALAQGVSNFDVNKRKIFYDRFQEILAEEQPVTFLWVIERLYGTHARIGGIAPGPAGIEYNVEKWFTGGAGEKQAMAP